MSDRDNLGAAVERLDAFLDSRPVGDRIAGLERLLKGASKSNLKSRLQNEDVSDLLLADALVIKDRTKQINTLVHALSILLALDYVLEDGEILEGLSLGSGAGGQRYDVETDRRIAEFKFNEWSRSNSNKKDQLFKDFVKLTTSDTEGRRYRYVVGSEWKEKFLSKSGRTLKIENSPYIVREYYADHANMVEIVDLEWVLRPHLLQKIKALADFMGT